jgi:lysophospholipase L1-like esterase
MKRTMKRTMKRIVLLAVLALCFVGASPRKTTWVAIGDSITYLNDHPDETGNRLTSGYMTQLTDRFPNVQYINQGHNGWTAVKIAEEIESIGLVKADVYTVFLGTNDWWHGKPIGTMDDYKHNTGSATVNGSFRIIINKLKSLNKKSKIILITPLPRGDFVYINNYKNTAYGSYHPKNGQTLEQFANAIISIGQFEKIPVVDLYHESGFTQENIVNFKLLKDSTTGEYKKYRYPDFVGVSFNPETDEYPYPVEAINMTYDGLHPSDKGNKVITDLLVAKWAQLN